jgi:aminoglycoside phosphotransferase (APT) family kinase protein
MTDTETTDIRSGQGFDTARLTEFLNAHLSRFSGPLTMSQFKGGQSNPTFLLESADRK